MLMFVFVYGARIMATQTQEATGRGIEAELDQLIQPA